MLVAVDTQVLIWGVRQIATPGQERRVGPAVALIESLIERGDTVALAAPAVAEFLVGEPVERHAAVLAALSARFPILPFDVRAVSLAAALRHDDDFLRRMKESFSRKRVVLKADIQIVAVAKAAGVGRIYSEDAGLRAVANRAGLPASPVPPEAQSRPKRQTPLIEDAADEAG